MDLMQAIRERRSIRKFKSGPVSEDMVNALLEAGLWAPSWANTQCWRFVVVTDDEVKAALAGTMSKGNPAGEAVRNAPVIIVICAELKQAGYYKGEPATDKGDWCMFDAGLAAQNIMLTAHALGLATVPVGLFDASKAAEILQVPSNVAVVLLLPAGYPAEEPKAPPRKELGDITFRERYGRS
ncbi:MAG: nitroreductase family protein [Dehalococcoidia bacterium]